MTSPQGPGAGVGVEKNIPYYAHFGLISIGMARVGDDDYQIPSATIAHIPRHVAAFTS